MAWHQGLQFKLALVLLIALLLLSAGTWMVGRTLVQGGLMDDAYRYQRESAQRIADRLTVLADQVQGLGATLTTLALQPGPTSRASLQALAPGMVERHPASELIIGFGIWPLPRTLDPAAERASLFWERDASGVFKQRADYNDPRAVPYFKESWFTPARYAAADRCYWTPVYREALIRQEVITCTLPLRDVRGFIGVATVSLSTIRLNEWFARQTADGTGYSLLVGRDNRLLGISDLAARRFGAKPPGNIVELAQALPAFNALALGLHQQDEAFVSAAVQSPLYEAKTVSALKDGTRNLSRQEAERALATIWNGAAARERRAEAPRQLQMANDAVLREPSLAMMVQLPQTYWRLIRANSERQGFGGVQFLFNRTLLIILTAVLLALLGLYVAIDRLVLRPLRRMTGELTQAESAEDALHLQFDESSDNEIGVLSHWHNERVRQLREMMERTVATNSQLLVESDDRRSAQEALAKAQERASLALQAVADGVIMTNERGLVEEINPVAEQLVGTALRNARGRNLGEVFQVRLGQESGNASTNLAELAIQRGIPLEYAGNIFLLREHQAELELHLTVTPIRTRLNRVIGTIVVFRPIAASETTSTVSADRRMVDGVTGLPNRLACDRALRRQLDGLGIDTRPHVLLVIDIDHLKRVNDTAGQQAGDEVLTRMGESLVSKVGSVGEVFRLGADEFAVVLNNFDVDRARTFAEALRELLGNSRIYWESRLINVTVSIGIVAITDEASGPVDLLRRAEDACGAAKRAGRNTVAVYDPSLDRSERNVEDAVWVKRIRNGLEQNLFHMTTQWVMASANLQAEGQVFEILLALEDEEGFWASPPAFMAVAERHHLIPEMDRWVLRSTLAHLARQPETLKQLSFCTISLSSSTLSDHSLVEYLAEQFLRHPEVPPSKLCFELREDSLSEFPNQAQTFCEAMRSLGVRVAVGNFVGRSPADVALVRRLNIDLLKVDALEFRGLSGDPVEQTLADSVIRLARTLRKRVIVTNISDPAALETWRRLGGDYLQGLNIAKPSPVVFYTPGA